MAELTLEQETALKQVKFKDFETQNRLSVTEIDEELEEGRVNLEKLDKRVRELETDLPELIAEKTAALDAQNIELRDHLNATIDTLNDVVKIINEQIIARQPADGPNPDFDDGVDRHHYLEEVNEVLLQDDDEPRQLTLEEVYSKYQSQPQTEEEWEEMNNAIKAAAAYENSLSNGTKIRLAKTDWTSGSPQ